MDKRTVTYLDPFLMAPDHQFVDKYSHSTKDKTPHIPVSVFLFIGLILTVKYFEHIPYLSPPQNV